MHDASPQTRKVLAALLDSPDAWHHGYDLSRRRPAPLGDPVPHPVRLSERGCLETRWVEAERPGRPLAGSGGPWAVSPMAAALGAACGLAGGLLGGVVLPHRAAGV